MSVTGQASPAQVRTRLVQNATALLWNDSFLHLTSRGPAVQELPLACKADTNGQPLGGYRPQERHEHGITNFEAARTPLRLNTRTSGLHHPHHVSHLIPEELGVHLVPQPGEVHEGDREDRRQVFIRVVQVARFWVMDHYRGDGWPWDGTAEDGLTWTSSTPPGLCVQAHDTLPWESLHSPVAGDRAGLLIVSATFILTPR